MNLKALLILFLLVFASTVTIALVSITVAPKSIKSTFSVPQFTEIVPLGELIDDPVAPS